MAAGDLFDFAGGGGDNLGGSIGGGIGGAGGSFFGPLGSVAGSALGKGLGNALSPPGASSAAISGGNPLFNDRNFITVAPSGVNIGELFRNFEGPTENGGFGLIQRSRLLNDDPGATLISGSLPLGANVSLGAQGKVPTALILAAGAGVVLFFFMKRRR